MTPANVIEKKRDGHELTADEIQYMVLGYARGEIPDYQMSALAMAIYLQGMTPVEVRDLTRAMVDSGNRLKRSGDAIRVDKHSTGGLGDKTSFVIAPMLACLGYHVPMISGRGLGITGGTLDKLESIPGYRVNLSEKEIESQLQRVGCVITGATETLAPADRKLYALRDVTATVPSAPLITASILSKKIAESLDALVLDVKFGSACFQPDIESARILKDMLETAGTEAGVPTTAILSDMNQPLGYMVGNACELIEAIDVLKGNGPQRVRELSIELAARAIMVAEATSKRESIRERLQATIDSGEAMERFERMIHAQGGELPTQWKLQATHEVLSPSTGVVMNLDGQRIGHAIIEMGGGRRQAGDPIRHDVGIRWLAPPGRVLHRNEPFAEVYCDDVAKFEEIKSMLISAITIAEQDIPDLPPLWLAD